MAQYIARGLQYVAIFFMATGEKFIGQYHSSGKVIKTFCQQCGSNLVSYLEDKPDTLGVPVSALEGSDAALLN